jgi:hypothetical protein
MIDLYVDDVTLSEIQNKTENENCLLFKNKTKDETTMIVADNNELVNIYHRARMRCETLDLIKPVYQEGR